jgi:hypothetical protein
MGVGNFDRFVSFAASAPLLRNGVWRTLIMIALAVAPGRIAQASLPALGFSGSPENNNVIQFTIGWEFNVSQPIVVDGLGYWDRLANGLASAHDVAIWTAGGGLVTSATVPNGTGGALIDSFRYVSTTPTTLVPGTYVIGGYSASGDLVADQASSISTIPQITFVKNRATPGSGGGIIFPTSTLPSQGQGFFGPNFTVVPEPGCFAVLGISACALTLSRRRHVSERRSG